MESAADLKSSPFRIIVLIDDLDRLNKEEALDILRLVRLVGDFPNITYLLAFDREILETLIAPTKNEGADYLNKIIQVNRALPEIPQYRIDDYFVEQLNLEFSLLGSEAVFTAEAWPDVYHEIVKPHIKTLRDVKRLILGMRLTLKTLGTKINLVDLVALESIRIFEPDLMHALVAQGDILHRTSSLDYFDDPQVNLDQQILHSFVQEYSVQTDLVKSILKRLFPATNRAFSNYRHNQAEVNSWFHDRRVANSDIFLLYRHRFPNESLTNKILAGELNDLISTPNLFVEKIAAIPDSNLGPVISALESFEGRFGISGITEVIPCLIGQIPRIATNRMGLITVDSTLIIRRIVLRILREIENTEILESTIQVTFSKIKSLSDKHLFAHLIQGASQLQINEEAKSQIMNQVEVLVSEISTMDLLDERDFISILHSYPSKLQENLSDFLLVMRVLEQCQGMATTFQMDSRVSSEFLTVNWRFIKHLFSDATSFMSLLRQLVDAESFSESDRKLPAQLLEQLVLNNGEFPTDFPLGGNS